MKILKFGGTSVGSIKNLKQVKKIVLKEYEKTHNVPVVVSAFSGVTDQLIELSQMAHSRNQEYLKMLKKIKKHHLNVIDLIIAENRQRFLIKEILKKFDELKEVVHGVFLLKELSPRSLDLIMSFGERLSAFIITEFIRADCENVKYIDTRELIITDSNFGAANINVKSSLEKIKTNYTTSGINIIPGFIATSENGITTTLGRDGSDLTASFIGSALLAEEIQIWTDVNGVMSANPQKVPNAFSLKTLSYEEAMELSHFGAKVLHSPTLQPAKEKSIPIRIMNTTDLNFSGTIIKKNPEPGKHLAKGITSITDIAILTIQGSGMVGVAGVSARVFGVLAKAGINVILISQASSEHSICIAVKPNSAIEAKKIIEKEFEIEMAVHLVDEVILQPELSIIAVVGEQMKRKPGISGRLFNALGEKSINVTAIAQGSSELNISVVISKNDEVMALRAIHESFFCTDTTLNIIQIGIGMIGKELISLINQNLKKLQKTQGLNLKIIGLANSKKMLIEPDGIDLSNYLDKLNNSDEKSDIVSLVKKIQELNLSNTIFIDCTASKKISKNYEKMLNAGASIIAANKIANTSPFEDYKKLQKLSQKRNLYYLYETNAGAGLPIISTIRDLLNSGDEIIKIESILSGTISYIFNSFKIGTKFSEIVINAQDKGYAEPDPRDDLSGLDFARKLLLITREIGLSLELEDIQVESILPENCYNAENISEFFKELKKLNSEFDKKLHEASTSGKVLRYIGVYEKGKASISINYVGPEHPFYSMQGSDNIISITTNRYKKTPLIIKGTGAGAAVTAAGLLADIFKIGYAAIKRKRF